MPSYSEPETATSPVNSKGYLLSFMQMPPKAPSVTLRNRSHPTAHHSGSVVTKTISISQPVCFQPVWLLERCYETRTKSRRNPPFLLSGMLVIGRCGSGCPSTLGGVWRYGPWPCWPSLTAAARALGLLLLVPPGGAPAPTLVRLSGLLY